ncbi:MAG: MFS transporter [Sneathiella sp.]|uniref:MFS transporter n=1 Tax=Sneathiella sp. TaxID=1964365 RepID=UPI003003924C
MGSSIPRRWIVLLGLVVARLAFGFQLQTVSVLAPGLMQGLALDLIEMGTLVGLFMLPGLLLALPGGMISQKIGERRFLIGCLLAMAFGGFLCGMAEDYSTLWIGRLISGFGAIGINVAMSKIVIDWFAGKEINTAMAIFLSGFPVGIALALVSLGHLATPDGWPLGLHSAAMFSFVALLVFLVSYRRAPVSSSQGGPAPRLNFAEVALVSVAGLIWALYNAAFMITVSFVPLYLISEGHSAVGAASLMGIGVWASIFGVPFGGIVADKIRRVNLFIISSLLFWAVSILLVIPFSHSTFSLAILLAAMTFVSSLSAGPIVALTSEVLRAEVRSTGMGVFYMWLYGGLALGPMMGGYVSDAVRDPVAPIYLITTLLVVAAMTLGLFRLLQSRYPHNELS